VRRRIPKRSGWVLKPWFVAPLTSDCGLYAARRPRLATFPGVESELDRLLGLNEVMGHELIYGELLIGDLGGRRKSAGDLFLL
jgi:hypothetical protein